MKLAFGNLFVVTCVICAVGLGARHANWRSDADLKRQFLAHRTDFEKLVTMLQEDSHLTRIAPDFTWLDDNVAWPRKDIGVSAVRWDEYRGLFRAVGAPLGLIRDPDTARVFIPIVSEGLVPTGHCKGLVYSPKPLSPVLKSLDEKPPDRYWERSHVLVYKLIEDHWYVYYEEW